MAKSQKVTWNPWIILPETIHKTVILTLYQMLSFFFFRLVFYLVFRGIAENSDYPVPAYSWYLGFKFDLRLSLILNLPFLTFSWIKCLNVQKNRKILNGWIAYYAVTGFVIFLIYFIDFGHFAYVRSRVNSELLDQMESLKIALQMAWETYPVLWALLGLCVLVAIHSWCVRRILISGDRHKEYTFPSGSKPVLTVLAVFCVLFGIYGKLSWYPLRWSDAFFSTDEFSAMVALNPVLYLWDTIPHRTRAYDTNAVRKHYALLAEILEVDDPDPATLDFKRQHIPDNPPENPPNIVLIHLESFSGYKTGIMGNALNPTPFFDELARKSMLFTQFFVPRPPTARSIYSALFGVPDIYPTRSVSRNPQLTVQRTLVNALVGYNKFYFIGGSATWGNIRSLLHHNIPGLIIYEEGDFDAERIDVWGVSDLDVFRKAHKVFTEQTRPFFAFIQTSGNHRPYSIPIDRGDFEMWNLDDQTAQKYGFEAGIAVDSMRFMDYCIAECINLASGSAYFNNTIFCMYGDHGSPSTVDTTYERLGLTSNHVPMVIYSPRFLPQGRSIDTLASSIDLMPTLVGLTGKSYINTTMGRDLLKMRLPELQCAYIDNGRRIGVLNNSFYLQMFPQDHVTLHRYRDENGYVDVSADYPEVTGEMKQLCEAIHALAQYMIYHNKPL
jgi:phosphoglycerol transferase MdoB-like AlkP superfamily enzyme